ncbi:O-methyltransferase [Streptosporangium subroseum]|uniref:O-methyltransferase n=1 Tax=Streptosporangium subroseum TaxID=106412 RepID=A0A239L4A2_9ACTN|nr:methyltransferase [Streptosporangium subroseum]SNT25155.1 O-methyltransferase [Streptosporangium subroseum]
MANGSSVEILLDMADLLRPNAIRVAAALKLADHIAESSITAELLAERTGAHPIMLGKLLRYLVELGVFGVDDAGVYTVLDLGQPLRRDVPQSVGQFLSAEGLFGRVELGLVGLLHTVRTGDPCYSAVFGREYWDEINNDPAFVQALEAEGPTQIGWDAELIIKGYDWSGVRRVMDVGGNNGTLLIELLTHHPHLHGTVLDLPNVARIAEQRIAQAGLAERGGSLSGSFFDPLPPGHDVYLLSGILADWNDERAVAILRACGAAAGPEGKVLLAEISMEIPPSAPGAARTDLVVAAAVATPVRTVDQLHELGRSAGLQVTWEGPSTPVRSLVEFSAAGPDTGTDLGAPEGAGHA